MDLGKDNSLSKGFKFALGAVLFLVIFFWFFHPILVISPTYLNKDTQHITNTQPIYPNSNGKVQDNPKYIADIYYLNQPIEIHDFEFKIINYSVFNSIKDWDGSLIYPKGKFILTGFKIKNLGKESRLFIVDIESKILDIDTENYYQIDNDVSRLLPQYKMEALHLDFLEPSFEYTKYIIYDIPVNTTRIVWSFRDRNAKSVSETGKLINYGQEVFVLPQINESDSKT